MIPVTFCQIHTAVILKALGKPTYFDDQEKRIQELECQLEELREKLERAYSGEEPEEPPLTEEQKAEIKAADEAYLASLSPEQRAFVLSFRESLDRVILSGTGDASEPRGFFQ